MSNSSAPVSPAEPRRGSNRWVVPGLLAVAALPVLYLALRFGLTVRNAAYWDEIETVLDFLLRLKAAPTWPDRLGLLFAMGEEHRTVSSRLMFVASWLLTGSVNFVVLGVIGNLCLVGLAGVLVAMAGSTVRRMQLAVLSGLVLFQLQHFESVFWSGSSIDHFQVVLLAAVVFAGLARETRAGFATGCAVGVLATFTLAQGIVVWPVGALLLAHARRGRELALWIVLAALTIAGFLTGFSANAAHAIGDHSLAGIGRVLRYWLTLLGAPAALGQHAVAPFLGAGLVGWLLWRLRGPVLARERFVAALAAWVLGAALLIAIGRVDVVGGHVHSRYYVLGGLAWVLALFLHLNARPTADQPLRGLLRLTPALIAFNLAANLVSATDARSWITCRDAALHYFQVYGRDGLGPFTLHPQPDYTLRITRAAEEAGIFRMPEYCQERKFPQAKPSADIAYFIDRIPVTDTLVSVEGWAAYAGREAKPGQVHLILQSPRTRRVYTTTLWQRDDLVAAFPKEKWRDAGFRFQLRRWSLPRENFQIGLLLQTERGVELVKTAHRLDLTGRGEGILATGD